MSCTTAAKRIPRKTVPSAVIAAAKARTSPVFTVKPKPTMGIHRLNA
jgi:hypothetical protein